ncbi:MAG: hypothetical protein Tsb002_31920 [Wenzhouxiangellaceae bacterium]
MSTTLFGHHAVYIWSAYGLSLAILSWTALKPWLRERRLRRQLRDRLRHQEHLSS